MNQLVSISDYYLQDVQEGTLFLSYPSSSLEDKLPPGQISNRCAILDEHFQSIS